MKQLEAVVHLGPVMKSSGFRWSCTCGYLTITWPNETYWERALERKSDHLKDHRNRFSWRVA